MSGVQRTITRMTEKEDAMPLKLTRPSRNADPAAPGKVCGHSRHVGWCGCCQRAQLERWNAQLVSARPVRRQSH
jgi:hypothetical protein